MLFINLQDLIHIFLLFDQLNFKMSTNQISFHSYMVEAQENIRTSKEQNVPCGTCTACCTSSYFKVVEADEVETINKIPKHLRHYSPGLSEGSILIGYDSNGHCVMLKDGQCSIYDFRPKMCREFDCRVFVVSGLQVEEDDKALISKRVENWEIIYENGLKQIDHDKLKKVAKFLEENRNDLGLEIIPDNSTELSNFVLRYYDDFLSNFPNITDQIDLNHLRKLLKSFE